MLDRLLSLVGQGGVHSYTDLARQLNVTVELVEQMLQDLARMGYLRPVADGCEAHCASCPTANACNMIGSMRMWTLAEKGQRRDVET
jgi:hypothetical protein